MPKKADKTVRYYVVTAASHGGTEGVYTSKSGPSAAARKAATKRFSAGHTSLRITVRERGTDNSFAYNVSRVKLPEPYVTEIAGKKITREYTTKIKKAA